LVSRSIQSCATAFPHIKPMAGAAGTSFRDPGWPKHGSWLDMAESELAVLSNQCLDRRIPNKPELTAEVAAWEQRRNKHHAKADWQFTTVDARVKLARLYPQFA
jgi:hypothetical protein